MGELVKYCNTNLSNSFNSILFYGNIYTSMYLFPMFLYDDGANAGGGSGDGAAPAGDGNNGTDTTLAPAAQIAQPTFSPEELKEFGFDSLEQMKETLRKNKENNISDEDKKRKEEIQTADFLKFSVDNKLLKVDEYNQYHQLKNIADKDLVYSKFELEYKEDNPELSEEELKTAAKEAFETRYALNSENEKVKVRAEAKIAREAKDIRNPLEQSYTTAKSRFDEEKGMEAKIPVYNKFINDTIKENTPDKLVVYKAKVGEDEVAIDVELTEEDRKEIAKQFINPKTFRAYIDSEAKPEDIAALNKSLAKKINGYIREKYSDKILQKTWETAEGIGVKKGSTVGADNPFPLQQGSKGQATVIDIGVQSEKANAARERVRNSK